MYVCMYVYMYVCIAPKSKYEAINTLLHLHQLPQHLVRRAVLGGERAQPIESPCGATAVLRFIGATGNPI